MFGISRDWNHDSAIFTTNNISDLQNAARYLDSVQPKRNGKLASDFVSCGISFHLAQMCPICGGGGRRWCIFGRLMETGGKGLSEFQTKGE